MGGALLASSVKESPLPARLTAICMGLPEALGESRGDHKDFRVRGKVFAYFLNNHHGDGIISVCCKVLPGDNAILIAGDPLKFYMPAYIGPRGWVGLRLDTKKVDWEEVAELVRGSYQLTAPKTLLRLLN
jgi:predicted DNA-binding protein (MmcQ/YjbR family)